MKFVHLKNVRRTTTKKPASTENVAELWLSPEKIDTVEPHPTAHNTTRVLLESGTILDCEITPRELLGTLIFHT